MPPEDSVRAAWHELTGRLAPLLAAVARIEVQAAITVFAVVAGATLLAIETPLAVNTRGLPLAAAFVLVLIHVAALPVAARLPWAAAIPSVPASLALQLLGNAESPWPWWPVLIVTQSMILLITGLSGSVAASISTWVASVVPSAALTSLSGRSGDDAVVANLVVFVSISGAAAALGLILAQWRQLSDQLLTERRVSAEEFSRRQLAEDRARIARELHDVVAHSMSIINIQASTARYRNPTLDERAIEEFEEIASSSRQALSEMRALLGVLRPDEVGGELSPQPGLMDVPELVAQAQRAGMHVQLEMVPGDDATVVSDVVGLTAYRIVQEALTNALRHAPGAPVSVSCSREQDRLIVTVRNPRPPVLRTATGSGLGLIGMTERVASVGGTVDAAATPDGGFSVRAILPISGSGPGGVP